MSISCTASNNSYTDIEKSNEKPSCCKNFIFGRRLEIFIFLFTFSYTLSKVTSTVMIIDKVCLVYFNLDPDICRNLSNENYSAIKTSVEKVSTNYQLGFLLIQTIPATIFSCFMTPWSDKYGRKLPIIIALLGMAIGALAAVVCAHLLQTAVEYYFIAAAFTGLAGGSVTILALAYSFASDASGVKERIIKFAFVELSYGLAQGVGSAVGGWMYEGLGYPSVFYTSLVGFCLSILWTIILIEESKSIDVSKSWKEKLSELFDCSTFREGFKAAVKKRPNQGRKQIILMIVSMAFIVIAVRSVDSIDFIYTHDKFHWGNKEYSTATAVYTGISVAVLVFLVPLLIYLKARDATLGLLGSASILLKFVGMGVAWAPYVYHVANACGALMGCANMAVRTRISKLADKEDLGKLFLFVATAEAFLPVVASIAVSQIFTYFLSIYSGTAYIILGTTMIIPLGIFGWVRCQPDIVSEQNQNTEEKEIQEVPYM